MRRSTRSLIAAASAAAALLIGAALPADARSGKSKPNQTTTTTKATTTTSTTTTSTTTTSTTTTSTTTTSTTTTSTTTPTVTTLPPSGTPGRTAATVPSSIPSDCSLPAGEQLSAFFATLPASADVTFPPGACYLTTTPVGLFDRVDLNVNLNGSTLRKLAALIDHAPTVRIAGGDRTTLRNGRIEGNWVPVPRGSPGQGQWVAHGVSLWGSGTATLLDLTIERVNGECVTADGDIRQGTDYHRITPSRSTVIDRLTCRHAARQGVATTHSIGFTLQNSLIEDAQQNGFDAEIDVPGNPIIGQGQYNRDIRVLNNTFTGHYFSAVAVPIGPYPDVGPILIEGNTQTQPSDTCYASVYLGDATGAYHLADVVVRNNTLRSLGDGVRAMSVDSGEVSGNTLVGPAPNTGCYNPNLPGGPYPQPVRLADSTMTVTGNDVSLGWF